MTAQTTRTSTDMGRQEDHRDHPEPADAVPMSEAARALNLPRIEKGRRLTGTDAMAFAEQVIAAYEGPLRPGIHLICQATDRSYGAIHRLLNRSGVLRARGGQADAPRAREAVTC